MSELISVESDGAPAAIGPYSQAIVTDGWIYCSGQIPLPAGADALVEGGVVEQTEQVLTNLSSVLSAAGGSLASVVKTTVFLTDLAEFGAMNAVYERHFGDHRPARATVQVAALPKAAKVEIECVARVGERRK